VPPEVPGVDSQLPVFAGRIGEHVGSADGKSQFVDTDAFAKQAASQEQLVTIKRS
jgi:hypothetical protein